MLCNGMLLFNCSSYNLHKLRCQSLVFFELDLAVVRIKEHSHNIGRIEVSDLVVLFQLQPANIEACHGLGAPRLTPSFFKMV
jgi:hypothetical protein